MAYSKNIVEKQGRVSRDVNHASDVEFIKKHSKRELKQTQLSQYIKLAKQKFIKAISQFDKNLLKDMQNPSLEALYKIIKDNKIAVKKSIKVNDIPKDELEKIKEKYSLSNEVEAIKKWKQLRSKYIKALTQAGQKLSDETLRSLKSLENLLDQSQIELNDKEKSGRNMRKMYAKAYSSFLTLA